MTALWTAAEAAVATGSVPVPGANWSARGVSIDTRAVETHDLYVALKGPRFDGHDFVVDFPLRQPDVRGLIAVQRRRSAPTACSRRRIMQRIGDSFRLLCRIDMRHHDPHRTVIQQPCALIQSSGTNPHDRSNPRRQRGNAELRGLLHREGSMLHVDE